MQSKKKTDDLLSAVMADETMPAVVREHLMRGGVLEDITLHAEGWWSHEGGRFEHERLTQAFFRGLEQTEGGTWLIRLGKFSYPVTVEDTGFFVVRTRRDGDAVVLELSDQSEEELDVQTLRYGPAGRLVARVKQGRHEARFMRAAYHGLLADASEDEAGRIWLDVAGQRVRLA
jgi:hypothetical protein